jgi:hypothetical protein
MSVKLTTLLAYGAQAISHPNLYHFGELLDHENIVELGKNSESAPWLQLLRIFGEPHNANLQTLSCLLLFNHFPDLRSVRHLRGVPRKLKLPANRRGTGTEIEATHCRLACSGK